MFCGSPGEHMLRRLLRIILAAGTTLAMSLSMISGSRLRSRSFPDRTWVDGFSADFVETDLEHPSKSCTGKMYMNILHDPRGMRRVTVYPDRQRILLWKPGAHEIFILDPAKKVYWEPIVHRHAVARIFRSDEPESLDLSPTASSSYMGEEKVNGRQAKHWEISEILPDGRHLVWQYWEDTRLRSCLKSIKPGISSYELTNLREGSQPASLFEIPNDFQEVSPPTP